MENFPTSALSSNPPLQLQGGSHHTPTFGMIENIPPLHAFPSPSVNGGSHYFPSAFRNPLSPLTANASVTANPTQMNPLSSVSAISTTPRSNVDRSELTLNWLLEPKPRNGRRNNHSYKRLLGCIAKTRERLEITKRCDPHFGLGVYESILWYNQVRWAGTAAIDPNCGTHREAVANIFAKHTRNKNYNKKRKEKSPSEPVQDVDCNVVSGDGNSPNAAGNEAGTSVDEDVGVEAQEEILNSSNVNFATNDFVLITDGKKTALSAGEVIRPFLTKGDDDLDFNFIKVKILQSIADGAIAGDVCDVATSDVVYIPKNYDHFANDLHPSKDIRCFRKQDCRLAVGSLVLLDLKTLYREHWPLVGKVKSYDRASENLTILWLWVTDDNGSETGQLAIDGSFAPWRPAGKIVEQTVSASDHYFCRFQLEAGKLPECAKVACDRMLDCET